MRHLVIASLVVAAATSRASFDLVLVADNSGSAIGPTFNRIHRYDGDSGVYLGGFNAGTSQIRDMAVNKTANELYIANNSGSILVYDYNTGSLKRDLTVNSGTVKFHNGDLYRVNGSLLGRVNLTTGAVTPIFNAGFAISDIAFASNGSLALFHNTTGNVHGYSSTFVLQNTINTLQFSTGGAKMATDFGLSTGVVIMGPATSNSTATAYQQVHISAAGVASFGINSTYNTASSNSFADISSAHFGVWHAGKNNAGVNSLFRTTTNYATFDTGFATPQVSTPGPIAVVVAPEPGTMAALGLGVAALIKRRRNKGT